MSSGRGSRLHVRIMLIVMGPISSIVVTLSRNADTNAVSALRICVGTQSRAAHTVACSQ